MSALSFSRRAAVVLAAAGLLVSALPASAELTKVRVGVTPGPHAQILEAVKKVAAAKGLDVEIVEFSDYVVPNQALDAGELEANSFQNQPYLDNQIRDRGFRIVSVGLTVNSLLGIYSRKHKSWAEVPDGARIAIQNDPTNGGRTLLLLRDKGVIKLKDGVGLKPTVADISDNPKKLDFIEIEAAQTPRSLDDVDAAAVNSNYAVQAGLDAVHDTVLQEEPKPAYINLIAVREADKDQPWVKALVDSYHSPEVKAFVLDTFKGAYLPAW